MAILKNKASKARPYDGIEYITKQEKTVNQATGERYVDTINMYSDGSASAKEMAKEFEDVYKLYDQCTGIDERKYYSFKLCFDNTDEKYTPELGHKIGLEWADRCFNRSRDEGGIGKFQNVISTHFDTDERHTHVITSAVDMDIGKKMNQSSYDMKWLKDQLYEIAREYGLTPVYWQEQYKQAQERKQRDEIINKQYPDLSPMELDMLHRMTDKEFQKYCVKERLRRQIDIAISNCNSREEFNKYMLVQYGVEVGESRGAINFKYGEDKKDKVRGLKLGEAYTADAISSALFENRMHEKKTYITDIAINKNRVAAISQNIRMDEDSFKKQSTMELVLLCAMARRLKEIGYENHSIQYSEYEEEKRKRFRITILDENNKLLSHTTDEILVGLRTTYSYCRSNNIGNQKDFDEHIELGYSVLRTLNDRIKEAEKELKQVQKQIQKQEKINNLVNVVGEKLSDADVRKAKKQLNRYGYSVSQVKELLDNKESLDNEIKSLNERATLLKLNISNNEKKIADLKIKIEKADEFKFFVDNIENQYNYGRLDRNRNKDMELEQDQEQTITMKY